MRKLVLYTLMSMDGVAEAPDRYVFEFDEVMYANLARTIKSQDAVLLGRRTYDEWAPYWPTAEEQPFADFINGAPKFLFSSAPPAVGWANTTVVPAPATEYVRTLKERPGGDIGIHGSIRLAQALLAADLVDELRLVISPVVLGTGRRLLGDGDEQLRRWNLLRLEGTPSGAVLADYELSRT
ncbi:dihydrofolate reductase family protein [Salinispora arenicola]|uniref:Dihydrofolate reductase n=2 Tax=Salinispora arenicola TaxID=168697 RepID=A0A542XNG0_SALAC|nr:dihydrofolate reductase family protein [Salinispora arenicola]TQL37397.1 dihydrofolate reductase [Salinispora arenicola]GIM87272.1 dihydrofolate reductase [Salinispora arenicola]